jgi:acetoin utilization protein AcuB
MLVKDYMTRHPIMIGPDIRITEAQKLMTENGIRHLPVTGDGKRLLGLVTRQRLSIPPEKLGSLDVWEITRYLADLTVSKVMVKGADLQTINPDATIEDAADLMIRHNIGSLPVVEDGAIVAGIITEGDLLIELQDLLGANYAGWRVTVRVPNRDGEASKLAKALLDHGWGIMAMGSVRSPKHPDYWDLVVKVRRCNRDELMAVIAAIPDQQVMDLRESPVYAGQPRSDDEG